MLTWCRLQCMEKGLKNLQAMARSAHKRAVAIDRADVRGNEAYHNEGDSGIGCSDEEAEKEVGEEGSHAPTLRRLQPLQPRSSNYNEHQASLRIPLYQPPAPVQTRDGTSARAYDGPSFLGFPFGREQHSRSPDTQAHRGVSIRSMLSHS